MIRLANRPTQLEVSMGHRLRVLFIFPKLKKPCSKEAGLIPQNSLPVFIYFPDFSALKLHFFRQKPGS